MSVPFQYRMWTGCVLCLCLIPLTLEPGPVRLGVVLVGNRPTSTSMELAARNILSAVRERDLLAVACPHGTNLGVRSLHAQQTRLYWLPANTDPDQAIVPVADQLAHCSADGVPCVLAVLAGDDAPVSSSAVQSLPSGSHIRFIGLRSTADLVAFGSRAPFCFDIQQAATSRIPDAADSVVQELNRVHSLEPTWATVALAGFGMAVAGLTTLRRAIRRRKRIQLLWQDTDGEYHVTPIADGEAVSLPGATFTRTEGHLVVTDATTENSRLLRPGDQMEVQSATDGQSQSVQVAVV